MGAEVILVEGVLRRRGHRAREGRLRRGGYRAVWQRLRRVLLELPLHRLNDAAEVGVDGVIDEPGGAHHVPTPRLQPGVNEGRGEHAEVSGAQHVQPSPG